MIRQTNMTSRVLTRLLDSHIGKTAPPPGGHETNVLTKFHENWAKNVTSRVFTCLHYIHKEKTPPPTGGHVFIPIWTIFELVRDINKTNVWTNHGFQRTGTIFELNSLIIGTNLLTKFHADRTRNVASYVFTRKSMFFNRP
ncbi:hypothetical protein DPMN_010733 [Dreissena polymorpha]|uniref:Uncharacterized protein n=1 Tax=Dreissena polymorpha TaxID=45954 RepID=A0A9D4N2P6_DREPO|nr:hypothetical protein DPMN_010733 [Dreissena polymorpha]